ncbi:PREDICTED: DNA-directed RNA polymerase III subunit rpc4 [Ipomoea nil]|uniref:DNA-directed RNA polymerase III subunit rpc4 n=1 Tax=Ipomoea nil TaxID=35883 RepID=UPI00090154AD|nr:PREDICTED: DNA-directed RNA polymerase III subunit rpc4 [Ipomoea nil]
MDPESLAAANASANTGTRKVRFAPKGPPRRAQKPALPKAEKVEEDADATKAEELLRRFNESSAMRAKFKVEKKGPTRVAFGQGGSSRSYIPPKGAKKPQSSSSDGGVALEKEYKEPWDYYTYYPTTLPLRRPYSGNPEVLDEREFGEASESYEYDEDAINPAEELGLFEEAPEENLFFVQLPTLMPMFKQPANAEGSETASNNPRAMRARACKFDDLPGGYLGKMVVYKSGAIKMKLGETLYDVSPGMNCVFSQDVVVMNTEEKNCCNVGEISRRAVITPDVESLLASMQN